ncbi:MAG: hypothetical protein Q4B85_09020 [Lachnospiraceae bacterium]|nr:hypothetical protein [Lachnospiraceae bacterium]
MSDMKKLWINLVLFDASVILQIQIWYSRADRQAAAAARETEDSIMRCENDNR